MRVVVGEDVLLFREGLVRILAARGFEVVGEAADAEDLIRKVGAHRPDVAITDIRMPPTHSDEGLRAASQIGEHFPEVGVVVLSQYLEADYAMRLLEDKPSGRGYLLKERVTDLDAFEASVRRVAGGSTVVDPSLVSLLVNRPREKDEPLFELSDREREILALMAEGRSNRGITERLVLSERTVESHVRTIFRKLDLPHSDDDHRRVLAVLRHLDA